jgi:hypothetical protein
MRERPLGAGRQGQAPNHRELLRLRAGVVSVTGKGAALTASGTSQGDELA